MSPVARGRTSILAWGHVRTASPRAALWILALLVPSGYSVAAGEVGRALAVPQTQTTAAAGGDVTWDFETGDLRGWTSSGTAFAFQPTRGDSPRSRQSASNHQGEFWIGTYERYQGRRGETVGTIQGDRPQGTLESQAFEIPPGPLRFLIGGGSEFATRVELVVISEIDGREPGAACDRKRFRRDATRHVGPDAVRRTPRSDPDRRRVIRRLGTYQRR